MISFVRKSIRRLPNCRGKQRVQLLLDRVLGPIPSMSRAGGKLLLLPSSVQDANFWPTSLEGNPLLAERIAELPADGVFIDIGANIGFYSLMAARYLGEKGMVLSIEPSMREFNRLTYAKMANKFSCGWELFNCAIGIDGSGEVDCNFGHTGMNRVVPADARIGRGQRVSVITLAGIMNLFAIELVDLVKIDVEGYELQVLRSFGDVLSSGLVKNVIVEITDDYLASYGDSKDDLYRFMADCGYASLLGPGCREWQYDELFSRVHGIQ